MNIDLISKYSSRFQLPAGTPVFSEGDKCEKFIVLTKGQVSVFKTSESGREFVLYRVSPENLCVLTTTSILGNSIYPANARSDTAIEGFAMNKQQFDELLSKDSAFRTSVFHSLSLRVVSLIETLDEVVFHDLSHRLLSRVKMLQSSDGWVHMTHQQLASELGTEREVVSRILKRLESKGILETGVSRLKLIASRD